MGSSVLLPPRGQPTEGPAPGFKSASLPNIVGFKFENVDPPSPLYIQRDDQLAIALISSLSNESITVFVRMLQPYNVAPGQPDAPAAPPGGTQPIIGPGYVQVLTFTVPVTGARVHSGAQFPLMEGYLLSVSVVANIATSIGQTFAKIFLNRGPFTPSTPIPGFVLFADYVAQAVPSGWPGGRIVSPTEAVGRYVNYTPSNPAAGADFSFSIDATTRARLVTIRAQFAASATVANRFISFSLKVGAGPTAFWDVQDSAAVTASQTVTYSLASGGTNVRGGGAPAFVTLPLPAPCTVQSNSSAFIIASTTQGIQIADQWSAIQIWTEEWFDPF